MMSKQFFNESFWDCKGKTTENIFGPHGTILKDNGKHLYMVQFDSKTGHAQDGMIHVGCFSRGTWCNETKTFYNRTRANRSYGQMNRHWQ